MVQDEQTRRGGAGRRIIPIVAALLGAAAIITAVWALAPSNSGGPMDDSTGGIGADDEPDDGEQSSPTDEEPRGPSLEDMVLNVSDLPSSWNLASPYAAYYQGYWPGNYSSVGGRGFNDTVTCDVELYLISMVFVYNNTQEAGEAMDEIKELSVGLRENLTWDQVGAASVMGDYKYFSSKTGKIVIFQQDHFVCSMLYYAYTDEPGDVTDEMMLAMADLQLNKLP